MTRTDLHGADLSYSNVVNADMTNANLQDVVGIDPSQLAKAKSLKGATMPGGSKHS